MFGISDVPIVISDLPSGTVRHKVRQRANSYATVFIKTKHGTSWHYINTIGSEECGYAHTIGSIIGRNSHR